MRPERRYLRVALAVALSVVASGCATHDGEVPARGTPVTTTTFGTLPDGREVPLFVLENPDGVRVRLIAFGAAVVSLEAPDREGRRTDIVLGFDTLAESLAGHPYFGVTVGRYANRIAHGRFTLDGRTFQLAQNDGPHHLHGGRVGFDKQLWTGIPWQAKDGVAVRFTLVSPDGDEGYPGTLTLAVTYTLTPGNELRVEYEATTDRPTLCNPTHHSYFNLAGSGPIDDHVLWLDATRYTPVDATLIPTGALAPVVGTPYDFTAPKRIGDGFAALPGFDTNYVLAEQSGPLRLAAEVLEPRSGRRLTVLTTEPGLQFYTGNFLDGRQGSGGRVFAKHTAFCLEAQRFPDAPNRPEFPSAVLRPGEVYRQTTVYRFGVDVPRLQGESGP